MQIQQLTAAAPASPVSKAVWADVQRFYAQRMHAPRWVRDGEEDRSRPRCESFSGRPITG